MLFSVIRAPNFTDYMYQVKEKTACGRSFFNFWLIYYTIYWGGASKIYYTQPPYLVRQNCASFCTNLRIGAPSGEGRAASAAAPEPDRAYPCTGGRQEHALSACPPVQDGPRAGIRQRVRRVSGAPRLVSTNRRAGAQGEAARAQPSAAGGQRVGRRARVGCAPAARGGHSLARIP